MRVIFAIYRYRASSRAKRLLAYSTSTVLREKALSDKTREDARHSAQLRTLHGSRDREGKKKRKGERGEGDKGRGARVLTSDMSNGADAHLYVTARDMHACMYASSSPPPPAAAPSS